MQQMFSAEHRPQKSAFKSEYATLESAMEFSLNLTTDITLCIARLDLQQNSAVYEYCPTLNLLHYITYTD